MKVEKSIVESLGSPVSSLLSTSPLLEEAAAAKATLGEEAARLEEEPTACWENRLRAYGL